MLLFYYSKVRSLDAMQLCYVAGFLRMNPNLMFRLIQVLAPVYIGIGNISAQVSLIIIDEPVISFKDVDVVCTFWLLNNTPSDGRDLDVAFSSLSEDFSLADSYMEVCNGLFVKHADWIWNPLQS